MQQRKANKVGRPKTPLISREAATRVALEVICDDGMQAFSLSNVAARLGVKTPSLYYHFSDKWELLAEVARSMLTDVRAAGRGEGDWEERLVRICLETRRTLLRHPQAAPLILEFFPRHLLLDAYDDIVQVYPFAPEIHMVIVEGTEKLTFGSALFEASALARGIPGMPPVDPETHPHLAQSVAANPYEDEQLFIETLRMFLAGAKAHAAAHPSAG